MKDKIVTSVDYTEQRLKMVSEQLVARGVQDRLVLQAMAEVPREKFMPDEARKHAYRDSPLPIGEGQTISQPYIVARMAEVLELAPEDQVLEIGTGRGYAAAVLSRIARSVVTIERHSKLAKEAERTFQELGYDNIRVQISNGSLGWPEQAPYDAIAVTAGAPEIPEPLLEQLASGGRLIIPAGEDPFRQQLILVRRLNQEDFVQESLGGVRFVPLIGEEGWQAD